MPLIHTLLRPLAGFCLAAAIAAPAAAAPAKPTTSPLATGEHQAVIGGVRFWYRVAGQPLKRGQAPLVYLHGGPGYNSHSFATLAGPALEARLPIVYYDQRGSGHSERPWNGGYTIPQLVEDVEALRRTLGVEKLALMGHSFGGTLALEYAAKYPQRVDRMILVGAAADLPAACRARIEFLGTRYPADLAHATAARKAEGKDPMAAPCELAFGTIVDERRERINDETMFPDMALARKQNDVDAASGLRNTGELGGALFGGGLTSHRFTGHDHLHMPVLILAGVHDYAIGLAQQRALAQALPRARIVEYERGGHFLYLDEPERFTRDVVDFMR